MIRPNVLKDLTWVSSCLQKLSAYNTVMVGGDKELSPLITLMVVFVLIHIGPDKDNLCT